jgi:PKHD-type hydroxylase
VNDHYGWHIDYIRAGDKKRQFPRKLSFSLLLNDDYEGGELEFVLPQYGMELKWNRIALEPKAGSLIVFPSTLGHRVKPVTKGIRKSIVGWCIGNKFT